MPKLLQISIEVNSGSVGRIAEQIGSVAIANGWESYITYARNHNPSSSKTIQIGNKYDVLWHGMETRIFDNHCLSSRRATKKLINKIKEVSPDVIQLHHIHGYFINMRILFNYLASVDIPVIWVMHDCWAFTGHCAHFDYADCNKWMTGCFDCPQKTSYPASFLLDNSRRNYNLKKQLFTSVKNMTIVSVSHWLGNLVKHSFWSNTPNTVIYNGVDVNVFSPNVVPNDKIRQIAQNRKVLLGVASVWSKRKGLTDYLALNSLLPKDYVIVLIGLSKKQIKMLPYGMIGISRTENVQELAEWYSAADVFINYTYEDNFPTVNLEALACGTPVITYRTGGSPEAIDSATGIIVEKGNVEASIVAIREIKSKTKVAYSDACRKRAETCYNKDERFSEYLALYEQLLK